MSAPVRNFRRDWLADSSPIPRGQVCVTIEDGLTVIGDGVSSWRQLQPASSFDLLESAEPSIVWIGDSFIDNDPGLAVDVSRTAGNVTLHLNAMLGRRLRTAALLGVGGRNTAEMFEQVGPALGCGTGFIGLMTAGINDIISNRAPQTLGQSKANLTRIFDAVAGTGKTLVTTTIPPSDLVNTDARREHWFKLNRWLALEGQRRPNLLVVDINAAVCQPADVLWVSGLSGDGTHPNAAGSHRVAELLSAALLPLLPATASLTTRNDADPDELIANPLMTGSGGTVTGGGSGTVPASMVVTTNGTVSVTARTDGLQGNLCRVAHTSGAGSVRQDVTSGFSVGDLVVARFEVRVVSGGGSNFSAASSMSLSERDSGGILSGKNLFVNLTNAADAPSATGLLVYETNPLLVTSAANRLRAQWSWTTTGAAVVEIGLLSVRKVSEDLS